MLALILPMLLWFVTVLASVGLLLYFFPSWWRWRRWEQLRSPQYEADLLAKSRIEPQNPKWREQLGLLYQHRIWPSSGLARQEIAQQSLRYYEEWLALADQRRLESPYSSLKYVALVAIEAGEVKKAYRYATRLLLTAARYNPNDCGNLIHYGHMVLGRIALREGRFEKAKEHLLAAGNISGSPQLDSFGPGMILAKELLEAGERKVVLEYFVLCSRFWRLGRKRLQQWTQEVNDGQTPNFGSNLTR